MRTVSIGLKHIRAQGGVTIAQDPKEAQHDSMPLTAISTGMVDWVLPVAQMPAKLLEFVQNENRMQLPPEIPEAEEPDAKVLDAPGGETISDETRDPEDESALQQVLMHLRATNRSRLHPLQARDGASADRAALAGELNGKHPAVSGISPHSSGGRRALFSRTCSSG